MKSRAHGLTSPNPSAGISSSFRLTPSEIDALRQAGKEASAHCDRRWAHLRPKADAEIISDGSESGRTDNARGENLLPFTAREIDDFMRAGQKATARRMRHWAQQHVRDEVLRAIGEAEQRQRELEYAKKPFRLTQEEIEALRKDARETAEYCKKRWAHLRQKA